MGTSESSIGSAACEDDSTLHWHVHLSEPVSIPGFVRKTCPGSVWGIHPQNRQLVFMLPVGTFDTGEGAIVSVAKRVQCLNPGCSVFCKVLNRVVADTVMSAGDAILRAMAVNVHDRERFLSLVDDAFPQPHRTSYVSPIEIDPSPYRPYTVCFIDRSHLHVPIATIIIHSSKLVIIEKLSRHKRDDRTSF